MTMRDRGATSKRGGAIVELALTLPILVLITLGTIDTVRVTFVKQSARIAAFECARIGIIPGARIDYLGRMCDSILNSRGIRGWHMQPSIENLELLKKGDLFKVTVSVDADANSLNSSWFYRKRVFSESVAILVEH